MSRGMQLIMQKYSAEIENVANIFRADKKDIGFISLLVVVRIKTSSTTKQFGRNFFNGQCCVFL